MPNLFDIDLTSLISRVLTLVIALTIHEFSHAFVADRLGDDTPRMHGRLTLNPLAHLDVLGSLMMIFARFGWAKPVPINPYTLQRRSPAAVMWVSLAGPMSNFLLAILAAIPWRLGLVNFPTFGGSILANFLPNFLFEFMLINLTLMLFNLIPIAPLDGDKIADYFFPASWSRALDRIRPYGPLILLAIIFVLPMVGVNVLGWIIGPPINTLMSLLIGV
jgi:Zn-dependent protease